MRFGSRLTMGAPRILTGYRLALPALLAIALAALVGCGPIADPTPTPTPVFASKEAAFTAAEEVYRAYNAALNAIDPSDPATFEPVFELSSGSFETADRENLSIMHAEGHSIDGDSVVTSFRGESVSAGFSVVKALVCLDVSAVQITDKNGASVVAEGRPNVYALAVSFKADDGELRIDAAERAEGATCENR